MNRREFMIATAASGLAGTSLLGGSALAQQTSIAIATGGTGGVYYPLGGGMANVLSKNVPGVVATARVTGGSVDNLKLIGSKQSEVALVMVDAALNALQGEDKFKGNKVDVRTLMVLYPNRMHVVSVEGKGIEKMSDLKGKRLNPGIKGSATEKTAEAVFTVLEVPPGVYTIVAERGPEFGRIEETVTVSGEQPTQLRVKLEPWIRMNDLGWW